MSDQDKDPLDPADWLASQFDTDAVPQQPATPAQPVPPTAPAQPFPPQAAPPLVPPQQPAFPAQAQAPVPPAVPQQPGPAAPAASSQPTGPTEDLGSPFPWSLAPGDEVPPPVIPGTPAPATPAPTAAPAPAAAVPPAPAVPPAAPVIPPPPVIQLPTIPAYEPPTQLLPEPTSAAAFTPAPPIPAETTQPEPTLLLPQQGAPEPSIPQQPAPPAFPGQEVEERPWDPWQAQPVDSSLEGLDDVIEAEIVGLEPPVDESNPTPHPSTTGDQFSAGDVPPPSRPRGKAARGERAPLPRTQKILIGVALGLVAVLALVALFLVGQRLASTAPAPVATPTATAEPTAAPTATAGPLPPGPLAPGDYRWDELLGGECLGEYESAWQERYTVVDCTIPHPAQMVFRGTFTDDAAAAYPGVEELSSRINLLCTAPSVINYQIAGTASDIQVTASFAATAADWDAGDRTYYCFVNRASGEPLTASVAQPQPEQ